MPSILNDFLTQIRPKPTPYKHQLWELGVSVGAVANYVGLSYPYVLKQINGVYPMTEHTESKIRELIAKVKTSS